MKAFLANVMDAYVYAGDQLLFTSKALTDSSISIGITAEEVRGGKGNKLIGRYFHDSSFGLTLQDALFELGYIAHNVGSQVVSGTGGMLTEEQVTATGAGTLTVSGTPYDFLMISFHLELLVGLQDQVVMHGVHLHSQGKMLLMLHLLMVQL